MKLSDAKAIRDEIRASGLHCIVPLGHGPDGYFARVFLWTEARGTVPVDFHHRDEWTAHQSLREQRRAGKAEQARSRWARSPIEILIDRACGLD